MMLDGCLQKAGVVILLWASFAVGFASNAGPVNTMAFGSCNHSHLAQPMWSVIASHNPDLFLWSGDVVYADTTDVAEMSRKYRQQLSQPDYQQFSKNTPIIGIWDDHDYGTDNSGKNNPIKVQSQQLFLDFLSEPQDSARRQQKGIYTSYTYGSDTESVKLFLLDVRYHSDRAGFGRADILGGEQWQWLENEIRNSTASVNLIVSGYSVLSRQMPYAEEWNDFKWPRKRLFHLIEKHKLRGVIFLTGDRHFSAHLEESVKGQVYHEFMSSGLTHYLYRKRVSQIFRHYYGVENSYFGLNFSLLEFHWNRTPLQLTFRVYDQQNQQRVEKTLTMQGRHWTGD